MKRLVHIAIAAGMLLAFPLAALAGGADVESVEITRTGNGIYRFDVTVRHDDEGEDHYADLWVVETMDGQMLGERVLHHPHVNEQPFTRSLTGVRIPPDINVVVIKARDSVHGFEGRSTTMVVPDG